MRRKPVGSVTELSLLLSSSNCWSNKSPASLSVSLLEHPLKGRGGTEMEGETMSCWHKKTKRKKTGDTLVRQTQAYIVTRQINQPHMQLICLKTNTHTLQPTHTWPRFSGSVQHPEIIPFIIMLLMRMQSVGSQPLPPSLLSSPTPLFPTIAFLLATTSFSCSDVATSRNSYVSSLLSPERSLSSRHGIPHHLALPSPRPAFIFQPA